MRGMTSGGMPDPVSATQKPAFRPSLRVPISIVPPWAIASTALKIKFSTTSRSSDESPKVRTGLGASMRTSMVPVRCADSACHLGRAISTLEITSSLKSTGADARVEPRREKSSRRRKVCEQSPTA